MPINVTSAQFSACVVGKDAIPNDGLPIIALVGRSNVGKSSLINTISSRKELARTSSMPGKTLTINFYCINEAFYIVDLPGYGYAKASKVTKQKIQTMMDDFFSESKSLKGIIQVLDSRHPPTLLDKHMQAWILEQKINYYALLTKTDKLSNNQAKKMSTLISKYLNMQKIMLFSSKDATGKDEFLEVLEKMIEGHTFNLVQKRTKKVQGKPEVSKKSSPKTEVLAKKSNTNNTPDSSTNEINTKPKKAPARRRRPKNNLKAKGNKPFGQNNPPKKGSSPTDLH